MTSENQLKPYCFLIADDHPTIRMVLKHIITQLKPACTFDETATVAGMHELLKTNNYDMVVLDLQLEDGVTITELDAIKLKQPKIKTLFFSICPEEIYAQRAIQLGANGFLNKKGTENEIREAITKVMEGKRYLSPDFLYTLLLNPQGSKSIENNPFLKLSTREFEVCTLLLQGRSNKEISNLINIGPSTVSTHRIRIFEKLSVLNEMQLNQLAQAYGVIFW